MILGDPIGNKDIKQKFVEAKKGDLFKFEAFCVHYITAGFYSNYKEWALKNKSILNKFFPVEIVLEYIEENTFVEYLTKSIIIQSQFNKINFLEFENGLFIDPEFSPLKFGNYNYEKINDPKEIAEIYGVSKKNTEYCYRLFTKFSKEAQRNRMLYKRSLEEKFDSQKESELTLARRGREIQEKYGRRQ